MVQFLELRDARGVVSVFSRNSYTVVLNSEEPLDFSDKIPDLPDAEVRAIAEKYLSERQLLPPDAQFHHIDRETYGRANAVFAKSALGLPGSLGAAPIIKVEVDDRGSIRHVVVEWPELESVGEYGIVSEKEAAQRLLDGMWYYNRTADTFDAVGLDWMVRSSHSGTVYVFPCYKFRSVSGDVYVPALADEYLGGD